MDNKLCLSSRVRIARNIKGFPFCDKLSDSEALGIIDEVRGALGNEYSYINFSHLPDNKKNAFVEQHLVSREFAESDRRRALFLSNDRSISVMVGEEDHIRIQAFAEGLDLYNSLANAQRIENILSEHIDFMFDDRYGYVTKCPTNLGTGIRASVLMFRPAITSISGVQSLASALSSRGITVRGLFGEGTAASASLYQISNSITLGVTEEEIIRSVEKTVKELEDAEATEQQKLIASNRDAYTDDCMRAIGLLHSSYTMSSSESVHLISKAMLGTSAGLVAGNMDCRKLYKILLSVLPHTLTENADGELNTTNERDKYRSEYLRKIF